jgi:glucose/arabinose dehydrogenase
MQMREVMTSYSKRLLTAFLVAASAAGVFQLRLDSAAPPPTCDPDNGGIKLPQGFCAQVAHEGVGPARQLTVAPNGDVYVARDVRSGSGGGVVALRDADGDGRLEMQESFGTTSTTGIKLRNGYLYVAHPLTIERYKMTAGQLKPSAEPETVVSDFPTDRQHEDKGLAFDGKGSLYTNVGAPSNACQQPDRKPGVKGQDPCPLLEKHAGIWKFDENKLGQKHSDGTRFATGLRQMPAIAWQNDALYIVMNNRDQLDVFWPELFTAKDNAERPSEPMYRAVQGSDFGWPYCFYDYTLKKLLLNPEYGGDGKQAGRCSKFTDPVVAFPAHWAPVDVMFYSGSQFPAKYKGGAFIAFHGSWNRSPMPQEGYNVTFQPFASDKPSGDFEVFATGFAGQEPLMRPNDAVARADGVAEGPDGSLYIAESQKGKIWRVMYKGK